MTTRRTDVPAEILDALESIAANLESGKIPHAPDSRGYQQTPLGEVSFNMSEWDCGTVCCIGGLLHRRLPERYLEYAAPLHELYYPHDVRKLWSLITPDEAAEAIRRFVRGERAWTHIESST